MSTSEQPNGLPAQADPEREPRETVSLVDLFDQMDRDAFRRALEHRDSVYPQYANRRS
jgi:hypothetical protein